MRLRIVLVTVQFFAFSILASAQWGFFTDGFSRDQLIKYTPNWTGERFPDGRPKVPQEWIDRLKKDNEVTSEEAAWGPIRVTSLGNDYQHQWVGGWLPINTGFKNRLIGRVFTVQFMPGRPEMATVTEAEAKAKGLSQHNVRTMDLLQPGDVVVVDMAGGRVKDGVYVGDNLAVGIWAKTGNGFVVNGGIRDREGIEPYGFPLYCKGVWPGVFGDLMLVGVNIPIRIDDVTVMPGDVVIGDSEGVSFVPPHLVQDVIEVAEVYHEADRWRHMKYIQNKGTIKPSDLYGAIGMRNPEWQKECEAYVEQQMAKKGLPPANTRRLWKTRAYSGTGCGTQGPQPAAPAKKL